MKKLVKRITRSDAFLEIISVIISLYLRFVYRTTKWHYVGKEQASAFIQNNPAVAAFWHNRLGMIPFMFKFMWHWPHKKIFALISPSADGTIVTKSFRRLYIGSIEGSSNRNAVGGYRRLLEELKRGSLIGIVPDGPRGPALQAKLGFIHLASKSKAAIIPVTYAISRYKCLNSWDKLCIPLPFSHGVFVYGDPIHIPHCTGQELENYRLDLERKLTELQDFADNLLLKTD